MAKRSAPQAAASSSAASSSGGYGGPPFSGASEQTAEASEQTVEKLKVAVSSSQFRFELSEIIDMDSVAEVLGVICEQQGLSGRVFEKTFKKTKDPVTEEMVTDSPNKHLNNFSYRATCVYI